MASVDALCQRLGIQHPLDQSTCIGYGQRKPTCGLLAAEHSRLQALRMLEKISRDLACGSKINDASLNTVAGLLLCKRWHQGQAQENAQRWRTKLQKTADTYRPEQMTTPYQPGPSRQGSSQLTRLDSASHQLDLPVQVTTQAALQLSTRSYLPQWSPPQQETYHPRLNSCSTEELISEVRSRLLHRANTRLLTEILDLADEWTAPYVVGSAGLAEVTRGDRDARQGTMAAVDVSSIDGSSISRVAALTTGGADPQPFSRDTRRPVHVEARSSPRQGLSTVNTITPREQSSARRPNRTAEEVRNARITALVPVTRSLTPEAAQRPPSPLRSSYTECGICMEPYEEGEGHQWECQHCLNRAHSHCWDTWRAATSGRGVRCMYCRVEMA